MVRYLFRSSVVVGLVAVALLAALAYVGYGQAQGDPTATGDQQSSVFPPDPIGPLGDAIKVQKRHTGYLMAHPDVVGTAAGLTADGRPAVKVYTKAAGTAGIPESLDGMQVVVEATGEFFALKKAVGTSSQGKAKAGSQVDTTARFGRPVPIGVSTGNQGECSAGTIGARVRNVGNGNVYALSNNHVYALENNAPIDSNVLQPGRFDTGCSVNAGDVIGTLADFEPIIFSPTASNTIDAAIALSSTANLGNATPSGGYGTPRSATVAAFVGQKVQKYGRTSLLTKGQVTGINGTILIGYGSGTARFVNQIIVGSRKPFIKNGDSGSLLVTDPDRNPVGLLYASDSSGKNAIANLIDPVLTQLGVVIDGAP